MSFNIKLQPLGIISDAEESTVILDSALGIILI